MTENEIKLWNEIFARFKLGFGHLDEEFEITKKSVLYILQSKGLSIELGGEDKEEILKKFINPWGLFIKFNLKDKNGHSAELFYYLPSAITGLGHLFLSEDGGKTLTEFTSFQKTDTSTLPIKEKGSESKDQDLYTKIIGSRVTTISIKPEGIYVAELKTPCILKDRENIKIIDGEAVSSTKFYRIDSQDLEGIDLGKHFVIAKVKFPDNIIRVGQVSIVERILKKLRSQFVPEPEKSPKPTKKVESIIEEQSLQKESASPDLELKKSVILDSKSENKLFAVLTNVLKKHLSTLIPLGEQKERIFLKILITTLKSEGLHFKGVDDIAIIKSIEECKIGEEGFELIDRKGRSYRLIAGDYDKLITIIGEDKIICIRKDISYPDEILALEGYDYKILIDGYRITTIGIANEGIYKNENDVCFPQDLEKRGPAVIFAPKTPRTIYYSEEELRALDISPKYLIKKAIESITLKKSDVFEKIYRYDESLGNFNNISSFDIHKFYVEMPYKSKGTKGETYIYISGAKYKAKKDESYEEMEEKFFELYIKEVIGVNKKDLNDFLSEQKKVHRR